MKITDILYQPIDTLLLMSGDRTLLQLYRDSEEYFTQVVDNHWDEPTTMLRLTISFIEQLSGKKYDLDKIPSTRDYILNCITTTHHSDISDCLRGSVIRLILMSEHAGK